MIGKSVICLGKCNVAHQCVRLLNFTGAFAPVFLCTGCTVCRGAMDGKERRMPMGVLYIAKSQEGGANIYRMYGQVFTPCNTCISAVRGGHISQGAREGGTIMHRLYNAKDSVVILVGK